jgi:probable HAF family extracellular repeat protein
MLQILMVALLALMTFAAPIYAVTVTWRASGTVIGVGNQFGLEPVAAAVGDSMSMDITLDTSSPCSAACASNYNFYYSSITNVKIGVGGQSFALVSNGNTVNNYLEIDKGNQISPGVFRDLLNFRAESGDPTGLLYQADLSFTSVDTAPPSSPLLGTQIPAVPVDPNGFQLARINLSASSAASRLTGGQDNIQAQVASFTILSAPPTVCIKEPKKSRTYWLTEVNAPGGKFSSGTSINDSGQITGDAFFSSDTRDHAFLYRNTSITDLGSLGGPVSYGTSINAAGQVTGRADTLTNGSSHAFIYTKGGMRDLGTLGGPESFGLAINDHGQVTGYASTPGNAAKHAFIYSNRAMLDLGTFGGTDSQGLKINTRGQVTGHANMPGDVGHHAFLYTNGAMTDLGTLGGTSSQSTSINSSGQITGLSDVANNAGYHAFLYRDGVLSDLGTLGGLNSIGAAINNSGQIAGRADTGGGQEHAFLYTHGVMKDLGTLPGAFSSGAEALNKSGDVVGNAEAIGGLQGTHGFLYSNGKMLDLNDLIDPANALKPYVTLTAANAITDSGYILAQGYDIRANSFRAYLLSESHQSGSNRHDREQGSDRHRNHDDEDTRDNDNQPHDGNQGKHRSRHRDQCRQEN